jgi:hypothetical protein
MEATPLAIRSAPFTLHFLNVPHIQQAVENQSSEHRRPTPPHRPYAARRTKPPGQLGRPAHTGAELSWRPPQWHEHESRGRCSYDGVLPQIRARHHQAHQLQPHPHTRAPGPVACGGRAIWVANWPLCSGGRPGRRVGAAAVAAHHEEGRAGLAARLRNSPRSTQAEPQDKMDLQDSANGEAGSLATAFSKVAPPPPPMGGV